MLPSLCLSSSRAVPAKFPAKPRLPVKPRPKPTSTKSVLERVKTHHRRCRAHRLCYRLHKRTVRRVYTVHASDSKSAGDSESSPRLGKNGPQLPKKQTTGSVLGAIALITGSTVGAGMLALPEATAAGGFVPSASIMFVSWLLLTSEALLMAEVNFSVREKQKLAGKQDDSVVSLKDMAEESLGPIGGRLTSGLYLFLANTLLVAYISKAGDLLNLLSENAVSANVASLLFTVGFGALLWKGSEKTIDFTNRTLTSVLLVLFGGLLVGGAQSAEFSSLLQQKNWSEEWSALPVVFLALVYHDLVPILCKYLAWNKTKIRTALVCGSLVPLSLFLAWDAVALALVPGAIDVIEAGGKIDPITVLIETQGEMASAAIGIFSLLAIATSFIGGTLGLSEFTKSEFKKWFQQGSRKEKMEKFGMTVDEDLAALILALAPPSIATFTSPGLFFMATRIAGGYGMTLLYGILPPIMAWCLRHPNPSSITAAAMTDDLESKLNKEYQCHHQYHGAENSNKTKEKSQNKRVFVPGGRPVLASLTSFAASIEIGKLLTDLKAMFGAFASSSAPVAATVNVVANIASIDPNHIL